LNILIAITGSKPFAEMQPFAAQIVSHVGAQSTVLTIIDASADRHFATWISNFLTEIE
jgi:hypothetical protein